MDIADTSAPPQFDAPRAVVALLPFLYLAWADGLLTPTEQQQIHERIDALPWLSDADRQTLDGWLDPANPPSANTYYGWIAAIRAAATHIPNASTLSLAELGVEMSQFAGDGRAPDEALRALSDLEAALGVVGPEITRDLLEVRPAEAEEEEAAAPALDVAALKHLLDAPYEDFRDRIRTLLRDPVFRYEPSLDTPAYRERVFTWLELLAAQGLGGLAFPERVGGEGDIEKFIVAFETLAYHDLSLVIKFGVQFGLFGGSIHQLGTAKHHEKYLPAVASAELPGCFAMSELAHGSNVRELETVARYDRETEGFIVDTPTNAARKEWIGNAARHGRLATVFAQLEIGEQRYGVHAFLVPIRREDGTPAPRVRIEDVGEKMGLNGVDNGRLWFDKVWIPRENLLDRFATVAADGTYESPIPSSSKRFFTMLGTLVGGRISVASAGLSAAKSGLTIAIRYGQRRRQFGRKDEAETRLLDYRTHQQRLFPLLATTYALHFAVADLRRRFAAVRDDDARRAVETEAAGLKAIATWHTTRTLQEAREACGGQGYRSVNRIPQLKADTDVFTTFEGDNTVLMLQVAKGLLTDFRQEFNDVNFFGLVRYLADRASTALRELNPVTTRRTEPEHLRDPEFQQAALRYREDVLLQSAARRLKKRIDAGMDSFDAFVEVQPQLVHLARAHVLRIVHERFTEAVAAVEDAALRPVLTALRDLYALDHLANAGGWFQANNYFEAAKARAIRREVLDLLAEIRPVALPLVDAFAIPDEVLAAPIALRVEG